MVKIKGSELSLRYRYALVLFFTGLIVIVSLFLMYSTLQKKTRSDEARVDLARCTEDIVFYLKSNLIGKSRSVRAAVEAPVIKGMLTQSNALLEAMDKETRARLIDDMNQEWMDAPRDSSLVLSRLRNPVADFLKKQKQRFHGEIGEIFLTNRYGVAVASTDKLTTLAHSEKYWWKSAYNNGRGRIFFDDRGYDESAAGYVLGIVVPVKIGNTIIGIIKYNINIEPLFDDILRRSSVNGRRVVIARSGGRIIKEINIRALSTSLSEDFNAFVGAPQAESGVLIHQGVPLIVASSPVHFFEEGRGYLLGGSPISIDHRRGNDGESWRVVSIQEESVAISGFYKDMNFTFSAGVLLVFSIALTSAFFGRWITKPLVDISRLAMRIGEGDFLTRAEVSGDDELAKLAVSINTMADNLLRTMTSRDDLIHEASIRKKGEAKFLNLFNSMTEGFATHDIILDDRGKPVDYRFSSINPAFERYTGIKASDAVGKRVLELLPGMAKSWIDTYGRVAMTGEAITFDRYSSELDRHFHIVAFSPEKGEFAVLFTDISEYKKTEQLLYEEKEHLAVTLESIGDGVITADVNCKVVRLNKIAEALTGWTSQEAHGYPMEVVFNIINEYSREPCENPVEKVLKTGRIIELANHTSLISKDGREIIIEDSAAPIRDRSNRIIGVVLVFRDSTEKKKLNETVLRTQKLESVGILAGGIAHDFNNLLSGIFGYIELAKSCIDLERVALAPDYLLKAMLVYERAKGLTNQLLTFSKGGSPHRKRRDLVPIIIGSTDFALSGSNVNPQYSLETNLWPCDCDESQIAQCVDNIIINAKQSMPRGGIISISGENVSMPPDGISGNEKGSDYIKITITDNGVGMPEEILTSIFDPFFSTKEAGHGLGLATVFSIVQHHDGWIDVVSRPSKGSTFTIYLPASRGAEPPQENHIVTVHTGEGKLLIMDDEAFILEIVEEMLQMMGYDTRIAGNGSEALALIRESVALNDPFDACILDLTIPGGDGGKEIAESIRRLSPHTRLLAASGYSEDPVIANPAAFGFSDSIVKPFSYADLGEIIRKNLDC